MSDTNPTVKISHQEYTRLLEIEKSFNHLVWNEKDDESVPVEECTLPRVIRYQDKHRSVSYVISNPDKLMERFTVVIEDLTRKLDDLNGNIIGTQYGLGSAPSLNSRVKDIHDSIVKKK